MSAEINSTLEQLPLQGWGLIALLVVGGLVLWIAGRRLLRGGFALAGLMGGLLAGFLGARWMAMTPEAATVPAILAGLIAAGLALLAYRVAVAGGLATVLALACPVAVWSVALASHGKEPIMGVLAVPEAEAPPAEDEPDYFDDLDAWLVSLSRDDEDQVEGPPLSAAVQIPLDHMRDAVVEDLDEAAESLPAPLRQLADEAVEAWDSVPTVWQQRLLGSAVLGAAGGFVLGMLASALSASLVTAGAGAMAWMTGGWVAIVRSGAEGGAWLPVTPHGWMVAWLVISVIGLAIQWTIRPRRADKPA